MRYLKKFNENVDELNKFINDLSILCNNHISWLKDDDFEITWSTWSTESWWWTTKPGHVIIQFGKNPTHYEDFWCWDDVKDILISLVYDLNSKYELTKIYIDADGNTYILSIDDILNDNITIKSTDILTSVTIDINSKLKFEPIFIGNAVEKWKIL